MKVFVLLAELAFLLLPGAEGKVGGRGRSSTREQLAPKAPALVALGTTSADGPSDLRTYCKQANDEYSYGQLVEVDWMGSGEWRRAQISNFNDKGDYSVKYVSDDSGEEHVPVSRIRAHIPLGRVGSGEGASEVDPACKNLPKLLDELSGALGLANVEVSEWLIGKNRHLQGTVMLVDGMDSMLMPDATQNARLSAKLDTMISAVGNAIHGLKSETKAAGIKDPELGAVSSGLASELKDLVHETGEVAASLRLNPPKGTPGEGEVIRSVTALKASILSAARASLAASSAGVIVPGGAKWWRFLYEYSSVESSLLVVYVVLICVCNMVWGIVVNEAQEQVLSLDIPQYNSMVRALPFRWLDRLSSMMLLQMLAFLTWWGFLHFGLWHALRSGILAGWGFREPMMADQYSAILCNVAVHFGLAVLLYYGLVYQIIRHGLWLVMKMKEVEDITPWRKAERRDLPEAKSLGDWDDLAKQFMKRSSRDEEVGFAEDIKKVFPLLRGGKDADEQREQQETFKFWLYQLYTFRRSVRYLIDFGTFSYAMLLVTFALLYLLQFGLRLPYYYVSAIVLGIVASIFLIVIVLKTLAVRAIRGQEKQVPLNVLKLAKEKKMGPYFWSLMQVLLLTTCFCFTRLVLSPWMWSYFRYEWLGVTVAFALVYLIIAFYMSHVFVTFSVMFSLPMVDKGSKRLTIIKD